MNSIFSLTLKSVRNGQSDIKKKKKQLTNSLWLDDFRLLQIKFMALLKKRRKKYKKECISDALMMQLNRAAYTNILMPTFLIP